MVNGRVVCMGLGWGCGAWGQQSDRRRVLGAQKINGSSKVFGNCLLLFLGGTLPQEMKCVLNMSVLNLSLVDLKILWMLWLIYMCVTEEQVCKIHFGNVLILFHQQQDTEQSQLSPFYLTALRREETWKSKAYGWVQLKLLFWQLFDCNVSRHG